MNVNEMHYLKQYRTEMYFDIWLHGECNSQYCASSHILFNLIDTIFVSGADANKKERFYV